jgi:transcriptional regulator with XRE-family HTH domain
MSADFWDRVVEAFSSAGLDTSQSAIARQLDLGQSAVAKWAHGSGYPTLRKCIHIAKLTGVSVEWLLTGRGNKKQEGGDMDELTQELLDRWADLSEEARRDIIEFAEFRLQKDPKPARGPSGPHRTRKQ